MMTEKSRKWMNAVTELMENPIAKVKCPECGVGFLKIKEELSKNTTDMYIMCDNCKKWNVVSYNKQIHK